MCFFEVVNGLDDPSRKEKGCTATRFSCSGVRRTEMYDQSFGEYHVNLKGHQALFALVMAHVQAWTPKRRFYCKTS